MTGRPAPIADWVEIAELYRDPFPIYRRLREEGGVHWVPQVNRYLVTSYEAVHETELNQELFSANEEGSLQIRAMGHSMLRRDDPEHYIERKAWQPALRPGAVKRTWTSVFRRNARRYLDEMIEKGPGADLVWDFAAPYAAESLREIIGLHNATQQDLQRWSQTMIDATGNYADDPEIWALGKQSFDEVDIVLDEMLRWHADHPDHSLISTLLRLPDYQMPIERVRANVKMTIGGGLNEPRDALGVAAWALLTHPEQREAVESDPSLWQAAFDETLRWVAPIGLYSRQTTRDTVLAGVRVPEGARLGICILSANRDERVWRNAEMFDPRREVKPHLAFGKGVHVCLGAWVARAEVAEVALPMLFSELDGLALSETDPAEIGGWVFRGMTKLPVVWNGVRDHNSTALSVSDPVAEGDGPAGPNIAIVGSGPAGCFTAQALKRAYPRASIDVFDSLPTPYGLVRFGVAPDHQGTKAVAHQFDRLFQEDGVRFIGDCRIGTDIALDELRSNYQGVVLATGMHEDLRLDVPGADLDGVFGAGAVTRDLNAHPDQPEVAGLGEHVAIIGMGNVAMDLARLLSSDSARLVGSDIDDEAHERLAARVRTVHLIGRSTPENSKFDPVMVRELAGLSGVRHTVHGVDELADDGRDARVDAVRELLAAPPASGAERVRVEWWFGCTPLRFEGDDRVAAVICASGVGEEIRIEADSAITAIGFGPDPGAFVIPGAHPDGRVEAGLYTAGWLRRGSRGAIPDQRLDARDLVRTIGEDLRSGAIAPSGLGAVGVETDRFVDFDGWRRIEALERLTAAPGRVRRKLRDRTAMRAVVADRTFDPPAVEGDAISALEGGSAVTILFGTESGGAELVADELQRMFGDDARVEDLADTDPADLHTDRVHLLICSTYGDGEAPTAVRPFLQALENGTERLDGVRYAMFGMGDRSYEKTYSRGSELVDEALARRGARRLGEYGRHDAGGPVEAVEAAREWAAGVMAELSSALRS